MLIMHYMSTWMAPYVPFGRPLILYVVPLPVSTFLYRMNESHFRSETEIAGTVIAFQCSPVFPSKNLFRAEPLSSCFVLPER